MGNTPVETGCGTFVADEPTLGVTTRDVGYGETDAAVYGRILTKDGYGEYIWSDWKKLDNSNCDDRERGETDFYDDFSDITAEWEAIALYNCETDGWALDSVTFWNGTSSHDGIFEFCDNVAGPSVECYQNEISGSQGSCYPQFGDDNRLYEYVNIDQDDAACPGITLDIHNRFGKDQEVGKVFVQSNPGIPDCDGSSALSINANFITDGNDGNYTVSTNIFYIMIASLIILLLVNIVCLGYKNCANLRKSKRKKTYSKVSQVISSEDDEAQNLRV